MSTAVAIPLIGRDRQDTPPLGTGNRDLHVKGVPDHIWFRARQNALNSRLPFKSYIIRLLAASQPFTPEVDPVQAE